MVLPHLFPRDKSRGKDRKDKQRDKDKDKDKEKEKSRSSPSSCHSDTPSPRPQKSSPSKSSRPLPHSRSSSSATSSSRFSFPSSRYSRDPDTHPLNLPPDELRRLSAMAMRDDSRSSMDIDKDGQSSPATPSSTHQTNGVNGTSEERSPTPPPHRSSPTADADSFKLAGNKFFKDGDYSRAVQEYNKG